MVSRVGAKNGLTSTLSHLDQLTKISIVFILAIIGVRSFGGGSAQVLGIVVDPKLTISVMLVLTAVHVLLLNYLLIEVARGWKELSFEERRDIFDELASGNLLTRGLFDVRIKKLGDWLLFDAALQRPFGTLYFVLYFLCVLACIEITLGLMLPVSLVFGLGIASFNWRVASSWILAFIDFGQSPQSLYFDANFEPRPRYFSTLSLPHYLPPEVLSSFLRRGIGLFLLWGILIFVLYGLLVLLV